MSTPRCCSTFVWLVLPFALVGRVTGAEVVPLPTPVVWRTAGAPRVTAAQGPAPITLTSAAEVTHLPPAQAAPVVTPPIRVPALAGQPAEPATPAVVPIGLDTVFRMAEEQNPKVALVRERIHEACADKRVAEARWIPDIYIGTAFYRHEGGIQNFNGDLIRSSTGAMFAGLELNGQLDIREFAYQKVSAQRKVWQQRGELSKVTSETLLEAASTYVDLLTARSGEAVARELEKDLRRLLERAEKLAATEPAARVEVASIKAELGGEQQILLKVREQAVAASAKLAYLLGIDPCTEMVPVDGRLFPLNLVDASPPTCQLVAVALASGPGIQEMEGLLALIQESSARAQGPGRLMPVLGVRMAEGGFGAGAGDRLDWDNRWDLGLQARWNLTEFLTLRNRRRAAQAQMQQAHLAFQDLRGKLTAGVQEGREAIHSGREQIRLAQEQIRNASRAFTLSRERLENNLPGSSHSEVLLAIRSVALAQINYLTSVSAYNKSQVRMLILLGPQAECGDRMW